MRQKRGLMKVSRGRRKWRVRRYPYFIVELRHLGVQFHVTALGAQSTMQADVKFTDAGNFDLFPYLSILH